MSKKKLINPDKAKFISSFLIIIISVLIVLFLSIVIIDSIKSQTEEFYKKYMKTMAKGYSQAISYKTDSYISSLENVYDEDFFKTATEKQIYKYLSETKSKLNPDFITYFYINKQNVLHRSTGEERIVDNNEYINNIFFEGSEIEISDPFQNLKDPGKSEVVITKAVKDINNNTKGILGVSIDLDTFSNIVSDISPQEKQNIAIIDSQGYFVIHSEPSLILKKFAPQNENYKHITTDYVIKHESEIIETYDLRNNTIFLAIEKIKNLNWTLTVNIPADYFDKMYKSPIKKEIMLILVPFITILILLLLEMVIMNFFQKKQMLATLFDPLTNLWTRQHFEIEASKIIKHNFHSKFMLIECDIRGFKFINQNYGEEIADNLIIYVSEQLSLLASNLNGIIGRGFADHFYIFVKISSIHTAMNNFKAEIAKINEEIKAYEIPFFIKYGIAFLSAKTRNHDSTIQELIGQASFAKSTIKDNMLIQYSIYNSRLLEKINKERFIENNMENALEKGEFFVMYQPKIELISDKVVGAEALVRWNSPKLGIVMPDEFIPLFERNGFIKKLDFYVYDKVFSFIQKQLDSGKSIAPISVNMSRSHSKPEKFMHDFMAIFNKYSIPPSLVEVEILERSFMTGNTLREFTELLHKEGFTVAMDDFGSGESSLNMLTQIPVDVLKFDRTFLVSSTTQSGNIDSTSANFIEKLIELSKNLKKQTIFEGVETQAQIDFLRSIECDQVQGFFFSRPLSEQDFVNFMELKSITLKKDI